MTFTNQELKALRNGLGLSVSEISSSIKRKVNIRTFQYWEAGEIPIPLSAESSMQTIQDMYQLLWSVVEKNIETQKKLQADCSVLPFFLDFDDFAKLNQFNISDLFIFYNAYKSICQQFFLRKAVRLVSNHHEILESIMVEYVKEKASSNLDQD